MSPKFYTQKLCKTPINYNNNKNYTGNARGAGDKYEVCFWAVAKCKFLYTIASLPPTLVVNSGKYQITNFLILEMLQSSLQSETYFTDKTPQKFWKQLWLEIGGSLILFTVCSASTFIQAPSIPLPVKVDIEYLLVCFCHENWAQMTWVEICPWWIVQS